MYVRSLNSNNIISTAEPRGDDWDRLIRKCLDNREADIAGFFQRHFTSEQINSLRQFLNPSNLDKSSSVINSHSQVTSLFNAGIREFESAITKKQIQLPKHGSWEVAFFINEKLEIKIDNTLLNKLYSSNPRYIGWPLWVILRNAPDTSKRPFFENNAWQALIVDADTIDFWKVDESGFYQYRGLEDDLRGSGTTTLDFSIQILRVAEAIGVVLAFSLALGASESSIVTFGFRWRGLKDRKYHSWTNKYEFYDVDNAAYKDEVISYIDVPLSISKTNIYQYVNSATNPLFELFGGYEVPIQTIEKLTNNLLNRNL